MATPKKKPAVPPEALAAARKRAEQTRQQLADKPGSAELLTPQELADAAPFYFELRDYIQQLKAAREAAGLRLVDVSERTGLAVESLSRLETGSLTNPTWKTLAAYAAAVGLRPRLTAESPAKEAAPQPTAVSNTTLQTSVLTTLRPNATAAYFPSVPRSVAALASPGCLK